MYKSYYDKVCELLYGRVVTCLHNSSLRLNHHFLSNSLEVTNYANSTVLVFWFLPLLHWQ